MKKLIFLALALSMLGAYLCVRSPKGTPNTNDYNFIITTDRGGTDILLIDQKNKDIRLFEIESLPLYPDEQTKKNKEAWPIGKWIGATCPPADPTPISWDYILTINPNGTTEFIEIEYKYTYDKNFQLKDKTNRTSLSLNGHWKMYDKYPTHDHLGHAI
jgi:hypothetical protein